MMTMQFKRWPPTRLNETANIGCDGFVLPLVLVVLAVLSLALWSAVSVFEFATRNIRDLRDDVRFEMTSSTLEARLGYLMLTEPIGPAGLRVGGERVTRDQALGVTPLTEAQMSRLLPNYLYLDGRPYQSPENSADSANADPGIVIRLQDRSGLINMNAQDEAAFSRMLLALDIDKNDAQGMAATLVDYTDRDQLKRLEGAEKPVYVRQDLPPPLDEPMRAEFEAFNALGWERLNEGERREIAEHSYAALISAPKNVNTASAFALRTWFDLSESQAARILKDREIDPYRSVYEFSARTGIALPESELNSYTIPSSTIRLRIERPGARCRIWEVWVSQPEVVGARPLFFRNREDMTCPRKSAEKQPDGVPSPFPHSPGLLSRGER